MINVYYAQSAQAEMFFDDAEKILSSERYEHFKRLKKRDDKLDCLAVGLLINKLFRDSTAVYKDKNGCPHLNNGKFISISHSGGKCAVAVSDFPVGLDIQAHSERNYLSIGRIVLCESELTFLSKSTEIENDFYKLWCLKESYMKALGRGFSLSPKSFHFNMDADEIMLYADDKRDWRFFCFEIEKLTAALCSLNESEYLLHKIILT